MSFRRGTTLPIAANLGYSERCDLGPTAGNGFFTRWPDDLALLSDAGISDLCITFDWSRFQPKPGEFASDWVERYEHFVGAASAIGINVWATLYDSGVPKWFANEGGIDDDEAIGRWWPRWAERVADHFGDQVDGWVPFAVAPSGLPASVWENTWSVLGGGSAPVALSISSDDLATRSSLPLASLDLVGVAVTPHLEPDSEPTDDDIRISSERWAESLELAVSLASGQRLMVSEYSPHHDDADFAGHITASFADLADSIDSCEVCFLSPAISGDDSPAGLFDSNRAPTPNLDAYMLHAADD